MSFGATETLDVRVKLVDVSVKLSLDHLIHRPSVSLLPSAHPPPSPTPGMTQDKLDKSDWLVKLLFVVVQIVQRFTNSEPKNKCHQPPSSGASVGSFEQVSGQVQEAVENSSGYIPGDKRSVSGLADLLVQRKETFLRMLQCLNLCSADKASVLLSATSLPQDHNSPSEIQVNVKPTSVEDGIVRLLYVIHSQVSDCGMLVDGILEYLKRTLRDDMESSLVPQKHLSEPLLLLLLKLLDSSQAISQFYEKGRLFTVLLPSHLCEGLGTDVRTLSFIHCYTSLLALIIWTLRVRISNSESAFEFLPLGHLSS